MRVPDFKDGNMDGNPAIYLGRIVPKHNFRAYIYGSNGRKKLVESWDEFESCMQSGLWFATASDEIVPVVEEKPKVKSRKRS